MSLADLLDIPVTTVSRAPDSTTSVPAAVFVITKDDIRRSGATSIPDALRLAPGTAGGANQRGHVGDREPRVRGSAGFNTFDLIHAVADVLTRA